MINSESLMQYLVACYRDDYGQQQLFDLFSRKVDRKIFLPGPESLLHDGFPEIPVDPEWGLPLLKRKMVYKREKQLIYAPFFLFGGDLELNVMRKGALAAPIFWFKADLKLRGDHVFLSFKDPQPVLNEPLLMRIALNPHDLIESCMNLLASELNRDVLFQLAILLENSIPNLNSDAAINYPQVSQLKTLKNLRRRLKLANHIEMVSAAGVLLVDQGVAAAGVLSDLQALATVSGLSRPLKLLLRQKATVDMLPAAKVRYNAVPAILSAPQQAVLARASKDPITVVIGPPGTGKSFTIASVIIEHIARGQSVLVASRLDFALDVIEEKIAEMIGFSDFVVRGGSYQRRKLMKSFLEKVARGFVHERPSSRQPKDCRRSIRECDREIARTRTRLSKHLKRCRRWGLQIATRDHTFWNNIKKHYLYFRGKRQPLLWQSFLKLEDLIEERRKLAREWFAIQYQERLQGARNQHGNELARLIRCITARNSGLRNDLFSSMNLETLLEIFPVWLSDFSEMHKILPLQEEMFDLAIIDEASLSDIASALPMIQRARRLLIVGDPHQLHHLSFVAGEKVRQNGLRFGLPQATIDTFNYREKNILRLCEEALMDQNQLQNICLLHEHFRSEPPIISFSNQHFYNKQLKIMTDKPGVNHGESLVCIKVDEGERIT